MRGGQFRHRGKQLGIALVAHQTRKGGHHHGALGQAQLGADARPGVWVGAEQRRVAPIADGNRRARDVQAPGVGRFLGRDGGEGVCHAAGDQLHGQAGGAARPGGGLVEQEAVARVGDVRHAGGAGGHAREEAADGHVGVHQVRLFGAEEREQCRVGAGLGGGAEAAHEGGGFDAEAFFADGGEQGAVCADADHLVAAGAGAAHQREEEVGEGEIDVGEFDDAHGRSEYRFG